MTKYRPAEHVPISEAARRIGVSRQTILNWERRGLVTIVRFGKRSAFVNDSEVARLAQARA